MTTRLIHAAPRWRAIAKEQVRVAGAQSRSAGILIVVVFSLVAALLVHVALSSAQQSPRQGIPNVSYVPETSGMLVVIALLLPLIIWQDEEPTRRAYHLSMPVSQPVHAFTKAFAGWVWLMIAVTAFIAFMLALRAMIQKLTGDPQSYPAAFVWWEWFVPFTSLTVAYVFASAAAVGTRRPIVWIFGIPLLYGLSSALMASQGLLSVSRSMLKIVTGYYGVAAAVTGSINGPDGARNSSSPSLDRWLVATVLWGAAGAATFYAVSRRRTGQS